LWLRERFAEQVESASDPQAKIQSVAGTYCQSHLSDPQCKFGDPPAPLHPEQLTPEAQTTLEERDQRVIELKRELDACRRLGSPKKAQHSAEKQSQGTAQESH
jgi:hypothetical protein